MSFPDYPAAHSMDTHWFAIDEAGEVAMFDTNEDGPVPQGRKAVNGFYDLPEFLNRDEFGIPILLAVTDPMAQADVLRDVDRVLAKLDAKQRLALDQLVFDKALSEAETAALKRSFSFSRDAFVELRDAADSVVFAACNSVIRLNETRPLFHILGSEALANALCLLADRRVLAWRWVPSAFLYDGSLLRDVYGIYSFEQEHQAHDFDEYLIAPSLPSPYSRRDVPGQPRRGLETGMATPEHPAPVHALPRLSFAASERIQIADLIRCYGWGGGVQEPASAEARVRRHLMAYCEAGPTVRGAQMEGLRDLAEAGDLVAQYVLGCLYARSDVADFGESTRWFEAAARLTEHQRPGEADIFGNGAAAQFCLADAYEHGRGVLPDQTKAIQWLERAADGGLARASYELGLRYKEGRGVPVDGVMAHQLLRVARTGGSNDARWELMNYPDFQGADAGDVESQHELAEMYESGRAVEKNAALAVRWYSAAVAQGHKKALFKLVDLLSRQPALSAEALVPVVLDRLKDAAERGDAEAQFRMGKQLLTGALGTVDIDAARSWLAEAAKDKWMYDARVWLDRTSMWPAAKAGDARAGYDFAAQFQKWQDYGQAVLWYRKVIDVLERHPVNSSDMFENGSAAKCNLAGMYERGLGVPQDYQEALYWYRKSAAQNNCVAQYSLGNLYLKGLGVARDLDKARQWLLKSAAQGYQDAQKALDGLPGDPQR